MSKFDFNNFRFHYDLKTQEDITKEYKNFLEFLEKYENNINSLIQKVLENYTEKYYIHEFTPERREVEKYLAVNTFEGEEKGVIYFTFNNSCFGFNRYIDYYCGFIISRKYFDRCEFYLNIYYECSWIRVPLKRINERTFILDLTNMKKDFEEQSTKYLEYIAFCDRIEKEKDIRETKSREILQDLSNYFKKNYNDEDRQLFNDFLRNSECLNCVEETAYFNDDVLELFK